MLEVAGSGGGSPPPSPCGSGDGHKREAGSGSLPSSPRGSGGRRHSGGKRGLRWRREVQRHQRRWERRIRWRRWWRQRQWLARVRVRFFIFGIFTFLQFFIFNVWARHPHEKFIIFANPSRWAVGLPHTKSDLDRLGKNPFVVVIRNSKSIKKISVIVHCGILHHDLLLTTGRSYSRASVARLIKKKRIGLIW